MSKLFTLNTGDFIKGAVVAVFSSVVILFYGLTQSPEFSFMMINWETVGTVAFSSFIGYLAKNFTSSYQPETNKKEAEEKVIGITLPHPPSEE